MIISNKEHTIAKEFLLSIFMVIIRAFDYRILIIFFQQLRLMCFVLMGSIMLNLFLETNPLEKPQGNYQLHVYILYVFVPTKELYHELNFFEMLLFKWTRQKGFQIK